MKDIEEMPPPPPHELASGTQPGENPWQELDNKPEPIDIDTIKDFIKQQKEKKRLKSKLLQVKCILLYSFFI